MVPRKTKRMIQDISVVDAAALKVQLHLVLRRRREQQQLVIVQNSSGLWNFLECHKNHKMAAGGNDFNLDKFGDETLSNLLTSLVEEENLQMYSDSGQVIIDGSPQMNLDAVPISFESESVQWWIIWQYLYNIQCI